MLWRGPDTCVLGCLLDHGLELLPRRPAVAEGEQSQEALFGEEPDVLGGPVLPKPDTDRLRQLQELEMTGYPGAVLPQRPREGTDAAEPAPLHLPGVELGPLQGGRPVQICLVLLPGRLVDALQMLQDVRPLPEDKSLAAMLPAGKIRLRRPQGTDGS